MADDSLTLLRLAYRFYRRTRKIVDKAARLRNANRPHAVGDLARRLEGASGALQNGELATLLRSVLRTYGPHQLGEASGEAIDALEARGRKRARRHLLLETMRTLGERSMDAAIRFGESYGGADFRTGMRVLANQYVVTGAVYRPLELLEQVGEDSPVLSRLRVEAKVLDRGIAFGPAIVRSWEPAHERRVLSFVSQCMPHHTSGYAVRTHWLLRHLKAKDWDIEAVARFGYPNDRHDFRGRDMVGARETVDDIAYSFHPDVEGFRLDAITYQQLAVDSLVERAVQIRPALLHCASNFQCGLPGVEAARRLGIPSIYEVRGLWHVSRTAKLPEYADSDHYQMSHKLEVQTAKAADHVFAITRAIGRLLVDEGVSEDKITVIPNGVDVDEFVPRERNRDLARTLGLGDDHIVFGFIGSFARYEGLGLLLDAIAGLPASERRRVRVLLVGDGQVLEGLQAQARRLRIDDQVIYTGRIPYEQVRDHYSLIDAGVYPRRAARVCEIVSPLKPLEAMAMGKPIVVSSVAALAETVDHGETGLIFDKDDVNSLREKLLELIADREMRERLGHNAREWAKTHRSWAQITQSIESVYRALIESSD